MSPLLEGLQLDIKRYLVEREVDSVEKAAQLAETFSLTKKLNFQKSSSPVLVDQGGRLSEDCKPTHGTHHLIYNKEMLKTSLESNFNLTACCPKFKAKRERNQLQMCTVPSKGLNIYKAISIYEYFERYKFTG